MVKIKTSKPEVLWNAKCILGERTLWVREHKSIYFTDIKKKRIQHFDLYRLKKKKECLNIGLFEDDDVISIIEWPEKVHFKPKKRIEIYFKYFDNYNSRLLKIKFFGKNVS